VVGVPPPASVVGGLCRGEAREFPAQGAVGRRGVGVDDGQAEQLLGLLRRPDDALDAAVVRGGGPRRPYGEDDGGHEQMREGDVDEAGRGEAGHGKSSVRAAAEDLLCEGV